MPDIYCLS